MTATTDPLLLAASEFLDHDSPEVRSFVAGATADLAPDATLRDKAVALYYAVRDGVDYDVYGTDLSRNGLRASTIATTGRGFCLHKSILYAAAVRSVGVESRLVSGLVRNHLASDRLKQLVGGDVFLHWLTTIRLDGRWLYATPVFNKLLCKLYRMTPLEFDGTTDALYHPFDDQGSQHMEFLGRKAEYDDLHYNLVTELMRRRHPGMFADATTVHGGGSLADEASTSGVGRQAGL
jgi:hypothetical protein